MEIDIVRKNDNPLLGRVEVEFEVSYPKEKTPARKEVMEGIKEAMELKKDLIVVDSYSSTFGSGMSKGEARIYKDMESAKKIEEDYILKRCGLLKEEKKKK
jgi:small subunit ribosomal protein S24e